MGLLTLELASGDCGFISANPITWMLCMIGPSHEADKTAWHSIRLDSGLESTETFCILVPDEMGVMRHDGRVLISVW
jgi:hypothetical protein